MTIQKLNSLLSGVPAGEIPASIKDELLKLVGAGWQELSGSDDTSMDAWKILRGEGPEKITWNPPCLSFVIDRHGGTALGSTRAERQQWTLNLESLTADPLQIGFRQLRRNAPKLDVKALADDVCKAVQEGPTSTAQLVSKAIVVWKNNHELTVFHGKIISGAYQRTISGRRKRFRAELETQMKLIGWELVSRGHGLTFKKTK
jgi:hypothetical protein